MIRVVLTKVSSRTDDGLYGLFPVGYEVDGILVNKEGTQIGLSALSKDGIFLRIPTALTKFSERPYHFATGLVESISKQDDTYFVETVNGRFSLKEKSFSA